jgi:hypothetical protein
LDRLTLPSALLLLTAACAAAPPARVTPVVGELSGVMRLGDVLLLVGDDDANVVYECPIPEDAGSTIPLDASAFRARAIGGSENASDLEAVDVLADGRIVALSEDLAAIVDEHGIVARCGDRMAELGGRGTEGLAVRALPDGTSRVAVCWEGGYPEPRGLLPDVRARIAGHAFRPRVLVIDVPPGARDVPLPPLDTTMLPELQVPRPPGEEPTAQRFRAADLVWTRLAGEPAPAWGFLVLLSSGWASAPPDADEGVCPKLENGQAVRYCYRWLQRFTQEGERYGEPLDLEPYFPDELRFANWEGLGWYVPGESVVLVYDESAGRRRLDPPVALVLPLPEAWRGGASPSGGRME